MEDQLRGSATFRVLNGVYCFLSAALKDREWFWGVVLTLLLMIGCVESNPGPRTNTAPVSGQPRRKYGSIESRHDRNWNQEEMPAVLSGCWPFTWWCRSEPLPDEEKLLGTRTGQQPLLPSRAESEDDELLEVNPTFSIQKQSELELEIDILKQEVKVMKSELERELKLRQEERKDHEEGIAKYKQNQEESLRINKDLQAKLDEAILHKSLLEQQLQKTEHKIDQSHTEEVDIFKKEFQRRKQLEEELEKEAQERKQMTSALQKEILERQRLEQDMRLLELSIKAERREQTEHNEEQEIQRRQLQHTIELELQKNQELTQKLEDELKRRQDEKQERYQLEVQLQEEIQIRHELEMEFKQADLQSQMLEQELRQQLREMQRLFNSNENKDIEVVSINDKKETNSTEYSACDSNNDASSNEELFDKSKGSQNRDVSDIDNDNSNDGASDEDEKREIQLLLLEEFQRLQSRQDNEKLPTENIPVLNDRNAHDLHPQSEDLCQMSNDSIQEPDPKEDQTETNLTTEYGDSLEKTVLNYNITLNEDNGDEGVGVNNHRYVGKEAVDEESDIVLRRGIANLMSSASEDDFFLQGHRERRKGILLQRGLSLGLENILEEYDATDAAFVKGSNISHTDNYSDIMGKIVNFQGQDITVASLIGETIHPETETLLKEFKNSFIGESKPVIGSAHVHDVQHYIPRMLQRKVIVRNEIFKHRTSKLPAVFAISGMTKQELQDLIPPGENICQFNDCSWIENAVPKFILLDDLTADRDYSDLCARARNFKAIHWLSKQTEGLEWKKSKGNIDIIRQYIEPNKIKHIHSLTDMKEEAIILSGNNGEGKSTYMTNLQSEINEMFPATWVIRLNLNEHESAIEKCDMTKNHVIELLSSAAGLGTSPYSSLEKALLKYSLQVTRNAVVLVDEIGFSQIKKGQELLRILKIMNMKKLIIATHSYTTISIENIFSTMAFSLKPLSNKELQMLMIKLWKTNLQYTEDTYCEEFSTALLHLIEKSFVRGNLITPFDIKILAHAFEKDYTKLLMTKIIDLPERIDMMELYEKYLKWGFEMYKNTDPNFNKDWDNYLTDITNASMLSMFPEETVKTLISRETIEGTIYKYINKFPSLHHSLQVFVVAKWLAENYQDHRSFIQDTYFETELQTVWAMYDRILAKQRELHTSVLDRDVEKVRDLVSSGTDINSLDNGGRTALHLAAIQGKYFTEGDYQCAHITSLLIKHGVDVSITDSVLEWSALRYADMTGSWSMIDRFLQETFDINDMACTKQKLRNRNSLQEILSNAAAYGLTYLTKYILDTGVDINTPLHSTKYSHQRYGLLHIASENGHVSLVRFLLENGAEINMCNWNNSTPLHLACNHGHKECVLMLLEGPACINESNKDGDTPLHVAVRAGNCDIVDILLNRKADLDLCNKYGDTPLHVACQENNLTAVSLLMDKNADENVRNNNGDSPLDYAIKEGHTTLVKYILKRAGKRLMLREGDGRTYVHLAAITGDVLMLDYLLQVLPEVNMGTTGGDTPLHLASLHGNTDAVLFLLEKGAENNKPNDYGNTPLHLASLRGNINTLHALLEHDAQVNICNMEGNTPLHLASIQAKANVVQCLIKYGADIDVRNREKNTPLQLAATKGDLEVMRTLLVANADVNLSNRYGNKILHQCAENGRLDVVKLLLRTGRCDVDARNSKGDTALLTATRSGFIDIVECLAFAGADINFLPIEGNAPIHLAVMSGNVELVNKLCDLGAEVNIRNSEGNTPLHRALYSDNEVMIRHLVGHGVDKSIQNIKGDTPFDLAVQIGSKDSILHML